MSRRFFWTTKFAFAAVVGLSPGAARADIRFARTTVFVREDVHAFAEITVQRIGSTAGRVSIDCASKPGTATENDDFVPFSETLTWDDKDGNNKTIFVPIVDDNVSEPPESFTATLSNLMGPGVIVDPSKMTITIMDNDTGTSSAGFVRIVASAYSVFENEGPVEIQVERYGGSSGAVSITLVPEPDSAQAGDDFDPAPIVVPFGDGQQGISAVPISIHDDTNPENTESFHVTLQNPLGGVGVRPENATTVVQIRNDDYPSVDMPGGAFVHVHDPLFVRARITPEIGNISYQWNVDFGPGSPEIVDGDTLNPIFRFPMAGDYQISLQANIGFGFTTRRSMTVSVAEKDSDPAPTVHLLRSTNLFHLSKGEDAILSFSATPGPVEITIVDRSGRLVTTLFRGESGSATQEYHWNGKDETGALVNPGAYTARIVTPDGRRSLDILAAD